MQPILDLVKTAPALCSTDIEIIKRSKYETAFNIYNHDSKLDDRPYALVAMHDVENSCDGSLLYERLDQFAKEKIGKHFNISIKEFLELPTDICDRMVEISVRLNKEAAEIASDVLNELDPTKS